MNTMLLGARQVNDAIESSYSNNLTEKAKNLGAHNSQDVEEIRRLSEQFEGIFLEIVLKSMRESVQKSEFLDGGNGEEIFRSMLDGEYAKTMASQRSSGLADTIENQLLNLMGQSKNNAIPSKGVEVLQKSQGLRKYSTAES